MDAKDDRFEQHIRETPEAKLELIEGRLIVGNSLAGSRYCLHDILTGWTTEAALAFAEPALWQEALRVAFAAHSPPHADAPLTTWRTWAESIVHEPRLEPAGPLLSGPHRRARELMQWGIHHACGGGFGTSMGHDFVMQLGEDGFTPDGYLIGRQATERLFERYLRGPADIVWEVLLPGRERQDREVKFHAYQAGGVPHYWIIDPETRTVDYFRLHAGRYRRETVDADGRYRPAAVPGLAFVPARLWEETRTAYESRVFDVESALPGDWSYKPQAGIDWDDVPFVPRPALAPSPVRFEEFGSWCPRAKFESSGDRPSIGGHRGTRNVLGMLLRTSGLVETVRLLHPRDWVAGLEQVEQARREDGTRKARWWELARQAAARLRAEGCVSRVAVIGDLTRPEPLHFWSELLLVTWDLSGGRYDAWEHLKELDPDYVIDLVETKHATRTEQQMIAESAIEIP
jgi:hypothetical protein